MENAKRAVVLLSAGLDSSVNLYWSIKDYDVVLALTFDYGQRAAKKEIECSKNICSKLKINHEVVNLNFIGQLGGSSLTDLRQDVPVGSQVAIDDLGASKKSAKSVWVPNRNGVFLNVAAAYAESLQADLVIPGFNLEEATTFADNSAAYIKAATQAFSYSTRNQVEVFCWTTQMSKIEIVKKGHELGLDWSLIWPCYLAKDQWCGECESCQRSKRAFAEAGIDKGLNFYA